MKNIRVLVTGGAGYIGSTATRTLLDHGYEVTILDDLSTGHRDAVDPRATFVEGSLLSAPAVERALTGCTAVMHFAGRSLVGESVSKPSLYWQNNVEGSAFLLAKMRQARIKNLIFSSSAAAYGDGGDKPIDEDVDGVPTNPYGVTKLSVDVLIATEAVTEGVDAISLRYFNVSGAHGDLGERHHPETHLIPNVLLASSENPVKIFGADWPTPDGTCVRDYIHVDDLIDGHIAALKLLLDNTRPNFEIINLGSGRGYSVREVISACEKVQERTIPVVESERRAGDPAYLVADIHKAERLLGWRPQRNLETIVQDAWRFISIN
jgi:UDP-glucose 4-epimerase